MKTDRNDIDAAFATLADQAPPPRLSARMIWLRGVALERQRAARRALRITRFLSAATLLLVVVAGTMFTARTSIAIVADQLAAAAGAVFILGYTALQLMRAPR